ncbi:ABC transporter ATP-binding protein [Rufibacter glacialis]|uniref:ABC transporter ATP-binding protein n=1 Tax=Rufibacter glacialis TaxID=1259555 RepID=A0A5M8QBU8_9BACT|nr:ABC transporter ATP-binding protein [Rufibacter glacialis]KAA6433477.1 ABC transporter ATP-binding protein [Rufibacter glacialis]GGK73869.1 ABC transporter ATP-binding protein [Rufibacter glacialis]
MSEIGGSKTGSAFDWEVLRKIFRFVKPYQRVFYLVIFLTVASAVLATVRPFLIQEMVDKQILQYNWQGVNRMFMWLIGLLVMHTVVSYFHTYFAGWLGQYVVRDIRVKLYEHILKLRLKFYDRTPIGTLVTRNVNDVETLSDVFSEGLAAMIGDVLQLLFILGYMFWIDWKLTLVSLSMFPLLIISTYIFKEKVKDSFQEVRSAVAKLNAFVQEHITGMMVVQIFNNEEREMKKFKAINKEHTRANVRSVLYYSIYFPVAEVIGAAGTGLLVWYGAKGVIQDTVTLGSLIAFIMYIGMFFRPIRQIADRFNTLQLGVVSSERIMRLLESQEMVSDSGTYAPATIKGEVQFEKVWFAYNDEDWVLKGVSFNVEAGQTVALVGATGAGKTSIINLLSRFYEINKGTIKVDGHDVKEYNLEVLRQQIGVVLQDVFLFSGTIADNISLGNKDITEDQMWEAARLVGADRFIERLPGGLQYNVMERGATLSVGQRQLISFVRAMVYNPKIIILDEATSSVDSETEELIQFAIAQLMQGRTSIVIAHRLSTIQKADNIIVLDRGEIKESGRHEELLQTGGYYAQLHEMQYKNFV